MKNNNKILYISIAILVLTIGIAFGTYAYYQTTISGTISGTVAQWSFTANNQTSTFALDFGSLYPGKSGTYNLELSAANSELPVYYEFIIHEGDSVLRNNICFDSLCNRDYASSNGGYVGMYGVISAGQTLTIPLYYNWPYERDDNESYADGSITATNISIIGRQYDANHLSIPADLFDVGITSISKNNLNNTPNIIPIVMMATDSFGYYRDYYYESIDSTSGYIINTYK